MTRHEIALKKLHEGTVIPATPLALTEDHKLDEKGQRLLMNYYLDCGVGGVATAVHTTQFEIHKPEVGMLEPVLRIVSEEIDRYERETGKVIVKVAGVCGPLEQAVKEAALAKQYGYDAVLLSPSGLAALDEQAMLARTKAVAEVMPVIGFYLQTAAGGRVFTYDYWEQLCAIPNVVAIKCASFNRYTTIDVVRAAATSKRCDEITLYTGNDDNIVVDLLTKYRFEKDGRTVEKAFEGGLLGHWSVWTSKVVELFDAIKQEKKKDCISAEMLTLAARVTDLNAAFFDAVHGFKGCITGLHEVLRRQGLLQSIRTLDGYEEVSPEQMREIDRVYREYADLHDDAFVAAHLDEWKKRVGD